MAQRPARPDVRVLSARELNRALLARQLLLERVHVPIPKALERVAGLQTQYAPAGYLALWARLDGFERDELTAALDTKTPHSVNTVLVDGQVAGTWRFDRGHVTVEPFVRLDAASAWTVKREGERLEAFHAEGER